MAIVAEAVAGVERLNISYGIMGQREIDFLTLPGKCENLTSPENDLVKKWDNGLEGKIYMT